MNPKDTARMLGLARLGVGVISFLAPTKSVRAWIGQEAKPYPTNMIMRGMAARDIALGAGLLAALENDGPARGWIEGGALADAGDAVGTLAAWKDLPGLRKVLLLAIEVGAAAVAMQIADELD
ncbi:MAG: hypothetical protein M3285_03940 [Actinomycetota bacterium]|nr:hypothetical protein [Actinomycetota bacterium]